LAVVFVQRLSSQKFTFEQLTLEHLTLAAGIHRPGIITSLVRVSRVGSLVRISRGRASLGLSILAIKALY
jgi:hypothetical protein